MQCEKLVCFPSKAYSRKNGCCLWKPEGAFKVQNVTHRKRRQHRLSHINQTTSTMFGFIIQKKYWEVLSDKLALKNRKKIKEFCLVSACLKPLSVYLYTEVSLAWIKSTFFYLLSPSHKKKKKKRKELCQWAFPVLIK